MNGKSRPARRLPKNSAVSEPSSARGEHLRPYWGCPCGAIVALREPTCPFCQCAFDAKYEKTAAA
jgi:hypothetical protein